MFALLPLFALYVSWMYGRKKYYYAQYAIFSIHFHSFYFLLMLVAVLAARIYDSPWVSVGLPTLVLLLSFVYLVAALRYMFGQSRWLSFAKGVAITVLYTVTITVAFTTVAVLAFLYS
jgi:predicted Na+-dependent transporter